MVNIEPAFFFVISKLQYVLNVYYSFKKNIFSNSLESDMFCVGSIISCSRKNFISYSYDVVFIKEKRKGEIFQL